MQVDMDLTVRENLDGKYLTIYANEFKESIEYAAQIKIEQIQLRCVLGRENIGTIVDFKELEKLAEHLRVISFASVADNVVNFESIYSLKNIEKIYFLDKQKFIIDISKFPKIIHLGSDYWKGLVNVSKAYSLTSLVLSKLPDINLKQISALKNLKILHIYSSKIQNLEGIERLPTEKISLARNNLLENIQSINELKTLKALDIEKCKLLNDFSFLSGNNTIEELFIDNLKSIKFISTLKKLKKINFWNCNDGDMNPLLESRSLEQINFYPNKKNYSHTIEQIIEKTGAKRGRHA
jgi:internalin A